MVRIKICHNQCEDVLCKGPIVKIDQTGIYFCMECNTSIPYSKIAPLFQKEGKSIENLENKSAKTKYPYEIN